MHDYFDILGIPPGARAPEIRRARQRRAGVSHPDVHDGAAPTGLAAAVRVTSIPASQADVAVDFVDMADIVDRMQAAFFARFWS